VNLFLWITSLCFFTVLFLAIFSVVYKKKWVLQERVSSIVNGRSEFAETQPTLEKNEESFKERIQVLIINPIRQLTIKKMSKKKTGELEKKLQEAGNPFGMNPVDFRIFQFFVTILFVGLPVFILVPGSEDKVKGIMMALFFGLFGFYYPTFYLNSKKKQRIRKIEKSMSDFFDLVSVSLEAGLGLDGALKKVSHQMVTPISDEFLYALEDMKLGQSRKQALGALKDRIPSELFKSVINSIIQADQMGIGMTKVIRAQTQRIREKHRQKVKEEAMKAPIKMLIPMVLFIFPTLFVVLLGPVVVSLVIKFM
jgi:tight adherence protein C